MYIQALNPDLKYTEFSSSHFQFSISVPVPIVSCSVPFLVPALPVA